MPRVEPRDVLLVDLCSERNRGDAAMNAGLVRIVRRRLPGARLTVMSASGANQWPLPLEDLEATRSEVDEIVGGFRPTTAPSGAKSIPPMPIRRARGLAALLAGFWLLPVWSVAVRLSWLDRVLPREWRRSVRAVRRADLVLWRGRNFRGNGVREPFEVWNRVYSPAVVIASGKPVACVGASIWPLRSRLSRFLARLVLGRTALTTLRDRSSAAYGRSLLGRTSTKLAHHPDLALASIWPAPSWHGESRTDERPLRKLGLTLVDWTGSGIEARDRYAAALAAFLREFLAEPGTEAVVYPQATNPLESTDRLQTLLRAAVGSERLVVLGGRPTTLELLRLYGSIDLLVATRMHSAVFALTRGVPVVTIPYDRGPKWAIVDSICGRAVDVPFEEITAERLRSRIGEVWAARSELAASAHLRLDALARDVDRHVEDALEAVGFAGACRDPRPGPVA